MAVKVGMSELIPLNIFLKVMAVKVGMGELTPLKLFEGYG